MTFADVVMECFDDRNLVAEFDRLAGTSLNRDSRSVIQRMVDDAAGAGLGGEFARDATRFIEFVRHYVWEPLAAMENGDA